MAPGSVNLVNVEGVRLAYGTRVLLDGVSLGVADGDRIGVVGRNGTGKSSLLEVLARRRAPDSGRVTHTGDLRVGFLSQGDDVDAHATVRAAVVGDRPDHAWRTDVTARSAVDTLLGGIDLDAPVGPLSGGERRRVALAAVLVDDPGLLLLDEPTNHLDVDAVAWLAGHLAARRGALVAVTHDRWFLDAVAERTWRRTTAATRRTCSRRRNGSGWRRRPRTAGATSSARSWRGCGAVHPRAPRSPGSGSTPRTR